uniref:Methyltransf_21 domain-containing protein n=1 Tax=Caenorhabditis japonica TaxID=281687 RepID=A0A8R1INN2_CAEJA
MPNSRNNQTSTIEDLANEANVTNVEILKIDIEGAEKTCLIPFLEKLIVCQIYLELHGGAQEHVKLLRELAHLQYRLFSYEINGSAMTACEYSFIHETCIEKYGGRRIAYFLDYLN